MNFTCLIVDDEPLAHKILENYIGKLDNLMVAHNCYSAIETINYLHQHTVDILFLDINMPELTGLEMLQTLENAPAVILTTAYSEFALEGYEFGVIDYLLKPIRFNRFLKAVNRFFANQPSSSSTEKPASSLAIAATLPTSFFVKVDGVQHKVAVAAIQYVEAYGNFVKIHLPTKQLLTAATMTSMLEKLHPHGFLRIHKSFIASSQKIEKVEGNRVLIAGQKIPIGAAYKQMVLAKIGLK